MLSQEVPKKANHILHLVLIALILILVRVCYLSTVKHESYLEKALKPQKRITIEPACRGTICDRFDVPLAINKIQYNAAICYNHIRSIPIVSIKKDKKGQRVKVYERREHIEKLAYFLGNILDMDPIVVEDLIHAKASVFPNTPFVIKNDLSEQTYYKMRMMQKDWVGLEMQIASKRFYPQGKIGCNVLGYLGAINESQYYTIANELRELHTFLVQKEEDFPIPLPKGFTSKNQVEERYYELKEKAYTINAQVGKTGIERSFDEDLRGVFGKTQTEIGAKGRFIRTLPESTKPLPGKRVLLSLSSELQAFAESLLIQNEKNREEHFSLAGKKHSQVTSPWIKGGAIVAMIPQTGEVVALASYPRFDPNDFISLQNSSKKIESLPRVFKWLESPSYIANLWDGIQFLEREWPSSNQQKTYEANAPLSWDLYLDSILSLKGALRKSLKKVSNLKQAFLLQNQITAPDQISLDENLIPYLSPIKEHHDKLLFFDLLKLVANANLFSPELIEEVGLESLSSYRKLTQAFCAIRAEVKKEVKALYHELYFPLWRKEHFKAFLKEKRKLEEESKTYARPYTTYLEAAEKKLFDPFWETHKWTFIQSYISKEFKENQEIKPFLFHLTLKRDQLEKENPSLFKSFSFLQEKLNQISASYVLPYLKTMLPFRDLKEPLWGRYYRLSNAHQKQTTKDLAAFAYPKNGFGFCKSNAYAQDAPQGSLFKLLTAYEALKQNYVYRSNNNLPLTDLNPLTLFDEMNPKIITKNGMVLGKTLNGKWITRQYKGGRMPRSHGVIGKVDLKGAIERSSNIYFSILASDFIKNPSDLQKTTKAFGFGQKTGIDLMGEFSGHVPNDIRDNRTGLYAFAIGQHSLSVTPLQSAVMFSALANQGEVLKPQITKLIGETPSTKEVKNTLFFPDGVRNLLLDGLHNVVWGEKGGAKPNRIRTLYEYSNWAKDYKNLKGEFIGKTSTAEFVYHPALDRESSPILCKDIWFGALSFKEHTNLHEATPELVVIVYLRFGDYGKEAAPLASQVVKKWREISSRN